MAASVDHWSPEWSNAVFSLAERDRRWAKLRALMARDGVDLIACLPCTTNHDRGQADVRYLTQLGENSDEMVAAFPIEGEVTAWRSRPGACPSSNWFGDIRAARRGAGGACISLWLNEHPQFRSGTIAITGLTATPLAHIRAAEGEANWQSVEMLKRDFPKARFVSATPLLGEARWQKSADEIAFLRKATEIAELTEAALNAHARAGVAERHVFAHMMFANADAGGSFAPMLGWVSGPQGSAYNRIEQPSFRTLQQGDVLAVEIEGRWGGYIAQIDMTAAIGTAQPELVEAMKLVSDSFDRVVARMKPGVTMRALIEAARLGGLGGRIKVELGLHGRGTGDDGPLLVASRREPPEVLDIPLAEGCCLAVKPSAALDGIGDYGRWGDGVVVTATGAERLGTRPKGLLVQG
ncbi:MAG TPA: M24 family metallopeptidase [Stellaceae bacterium]|nr:M24 family metallopeptidase [Stellaceae bacterium]